MVNVPRAGVLRREIEDRDLDGVVAALLRGFPHRPRAFWERGIARLAARPKIDGCPRYGMLLAQGDRPVGVALMLYSEVPGDPPQIRCNLSSWTVDPAFRMHAPLLVGPALKRRDVTFTNLSAAPHTWRTIEAQGFRPTSSRQALAWTAVAARHEPARVSADPRGWAGLPEARLLDDHHGYGCTVLVVEASDGPHPFVTVPVRLRSGRLRVPLAQLIYSRDLSSFARFAGVIGRRLLGLGALGVVMDGDLAPGSVPVWRGFRQVRHYAKGPHSPRPGDLSYTERAIFGP